MYGFIEKNLQKQRCEMDEWYAKKFAELPLSEDVVVEKNIPYLNDNKECHKMDVYYPNKDVYHPNKKEGKIPVIFDFHGGGLLCCDRSFNRWFCSEMARRGFLVFCIDYPLVPSTDVYGILKDSYEGTRKAYQLAEQYGGDKNRIFLCGDSAGAFISTYLCAVQNFVPVAESLGIKTAEIPVKAAGAISGMFYSSRVDKQGIFILRKYFYGKNYRKSPFWKYVNLENQQLIENFPPTFCVTSKDDYLREYTIRFVRAMQRYKRQVQLEDYEVQVQPEGYEKHPELTHDFVCLMPERKESQDAMDKMAEFFLRY